MRRAEHELPTWPFLFGVGGAVGLLAYFLFGRRGQIMGLADRYLTAGQGGLFAIVLPASVGQYAEMLIDAAARHGVSPWALAAIMYHESRGGDALRPPGPGGSGDFIARPASGRYAPFMDPSTGLPRDGHGWGRGLMQIDYGAHNAWVTSSSWWDPWTNIDKGARVLAEGMNYLRQRGLSGDQLLEAAVAAYNAGPGNVWSAIQAGDSPSSVTTGGNYASKVLSKAGGWASDFDRAVS